jgi:hypothetical protein
MTSKKIKCESAFIRVNPEISKIFLPVMLSEPQPR